MLLAFEKPRGCFINVLRALQNILSKFVYRRNCTSYENFKLKIFMYAQSFSLKFSPPIWSLALYIFARLFWRARETLVKHNTHTHHGQIHKSQYAPIPYLRILHSEQKCAHFCSEWSNKAFWDMEQVHSGICEIGLSRNWVGSSIWTQHSTSSGVLTFRELYPLLGIAPWEKWLHFVIPGCI